MERMNLFGDSKQKVNTKPKKKEHSKEFKELAVNLASKIGVTKAAEELGISASSIYSWKKILNTSTLAKTPAPIQDEDGNLIFSLEGKTYSLNVNSKEEREVVKEDINSNSLAKYNWFKEETGEKHWVLYNTEMYEVKETFIHEKYIHYKENSNLAPIIPINATSCRNMFSDCDKLTELNLSKLNTVNIVSMKGMFKNCRKITTLDLDNLITSKVTDMSSMFEACTKLVNLNLSNFDTSNVTHMCFMFEHNLNLTALDLSSFDTSKVTWMYYMFQDCKRLKSLDLSNFDTSNLEEMEYMFSGCESLEVLDLSNFNTFKVRMLNSAFMNCKRLTVLDIRGFYTSYLVKPYRPAESERDPNALYGYFPEIHEVSIQNLFHGCNSLKLLKVNKHFQKSYKMHLSYDVQIEIV